MAKGLGPPPSRDLPGNKQRQYTGETKDIRDKSQRSRGLGDDVSIKVEESRRDGRKQHGGSEDEEPRRKERRNLEPQTTDPARNRRMRSPRAKSPQSVRLPQTRGLPEVLSSRGKVLRDRSAREGNMNSRNGLYDLRDKERRHNEPREKNRRTKDILDRDLRERERRMRDPRDKERRLGVPRDRDLRARDARDRDPRDRERRGKALHERDLFDDVPREQLSRDLSRQNLQRRMPSTERGRSRKPDRSPDPTRGAGKVRGETSSTCRTASTTLSAALLSNKERRPLKDRRSRRRMDEEEQSNAFADSVFSIFSLAGSDLEDSRGKARNDAEVKKNAVLRPKSKVIKRESKEKKEHLDFSASSSSVKSLDMSLITQKYLKPKPTLTQRSKFQLTIEESNDEESTRKSSRNNISQAKEYKNDRGETPKMLPPFRKIKTGNDSFRDSSEILREQDRTGDGNKRSSQNSFTMSISEYDGFEQTRPVFHGNKSSSDRNNDDEDVTRPRAASDRENESSAAKLRAKKKAIAGIDAASLEAITKGFTATKYQLTSRDQKMISHITELEVTVLQYQKEIVDLLDMYNEAVKRSQKAQRGLQRAKVRIARYEKAHAAVSRAIRTGKLYMKQREYMAAILELSRAAGIEPSNATLWYLLAECRLLVGQPAAAEKACMTCLKLQPTGVGVAMLGRILHKRGRHDEAIECYLSALGRNDESEDEQDSE
ncbi:putative tetratricopeptide-like helical domain superfamily [Plasmopara halstedii]